MLDFDHDALTVRQRGAMRLPNRGRADRLIFERGKKPLNRLTQLFGDDGANHLRRVRRNIGLQPGKFARKRRADKIGSGAENLA